MLTTSLSLSLFQRCRWCDRLRRSPRSFRCGSSLKSPVVAAGASAEASSSAAPDGAGLDGAVLEAGAVAGAGGGPLLAKEAARGGGGGVRHNRGEREVRRRQLQICL